MVKQSRKVYVDVTLKNNKEGEIRPLSIAWEDGKVYEIDKVKNRCRASSTKVGGCGVRYTIIIGHKETYLFHEENKWFVEAKVNV